MRFRQPVDRLCTTSQPQQKGARGFGLAPSFCATELTKICEFRSNLSPQPCVSWLFRRTLVSTDRIGVQTMSEQVTNANEQILAAPSELSQQELETVSGGAAVDYFDRASPLFFGKLELNPQPLPPG
jgi:hypothetical protein